MFRPGRCRWLAVSLLALLGAGASARPAAAAGCHAPDRPVLGLSMDWDAPLAGSMAATPATAAFGRLPCSQHVPGAPQPAPVDATLFGAAEPPLPAAAIPSHPFARVEAPLRARHESSVRPRPPRRFGAIG